MLLGLESSPARRSIAKRLPSESAADANAIRCADPFHVVGWATEALDTVRRDAWNNARRGGHTRNHGWAHGRRATVATGPALALRRARYAL